MIDKNPTCDIFIHTYTLKDGFSNPRNKEKRVPVDSRDVVALNATGTMITNVPTTAQMEHFLGINITVALLKHFPPKKSGWFYPDSMLNMFKQWISIQLVWSLMPAKYCRVGLFRLDTRLENDVNIFDGEAVVPDFMNWKGHFTNDQLFYGLYKYGDAWATTRNKLLPEYLNRHKTLHSERIVRFVLQSCSAPLTFRPICLTRVRGGGKLAKNRCCKDGCTKSLAGDGPRAVF